MDWFTNYVWKPYGETLRSVIIIVIGVLLTGLAQITDLGDLDGAWWQAIVLAALQQVVAFVRGILPSS